MTPPKTSPLRILQIIGRMDRGGAEVMLMNVYRAIDKQKIQFDFLYFTSDTCAFDEEIRELGGRIYRIDVNNPIVRTCRIYSLIRQQRWSVVHSHTLFSSGLHLLAARLAGAPHRIMHSHSTQDESNAGPFGRVYKAIAKRLIRCFSTRKLACGEAAAMYMFGPNNAASIIPNAIDLTEFVTSKDIRRAAGRIKNNNYLTIVQVSRFLPVKNHLRSVEIAKHLRTSRTPFQLLFVGAGPGEGEVRSIVEAYGLSDVVLFLGLRDDIAKILANADVLIMPSLFEGFPVTIVEAQAAGVPCVISDTISKEVDLGLGIISFVSLESDNQTWVNAIRAAASVSVPSNLVRHTSLTNAGFSSEAAARRLESIYL